MQVDGQRDERTDRLGWTFTRQIFLLISETILRADSINKKQFEKSIFKDFFQTQLLNLFDVDYNKLQRRLDNDLTQGKCYKTFYGSGLTRNYQTRLERLAGDEHSSFLCKFVNYGRKKFYNIDLGVNKTFYDLNALVFVKSQSVCPLRVFPAQSNVCR